MPLMSMVLALTAVAAKGDGPSTKPSEGKAAKNSARWGFAPYNKLSGLTGEQKSKIAEIHKKANMEITAIEDKEQADILALLTDEQKEELEKMTADKKEKAMEKRTAKKEADGEKDKDSDKK